MTKDVPMTASERQRRNKGIENRYVRRKKDTPTVPNMVEPSPQHTSPRRGDSEATAVDPALHDVESSRSESDLGVGSSESDEESPYPTAEDVVRGLGEGSSSGATPLDVEDDGGPIDKSVLKSFETHVSHAIWKRTEEARKFPLTTISHYPKMKDWDLKEEVSEVQQRVARCGLMNLVQYGYRYIDYVVVSAFVERWQPETNTFHLPFGEMTITLDDVRHILGVPIEGDCVYSEDGGREIQPQTAIEMVVELLGIDDKEVKEETHRSYAVRLDWIKQNFMKQAKEDSSEEYLDQCARAYILYLLGCVVFPDKTKNKISIYYLGCLKDLDKVGDFGWGMAILGHLYRQLGLASRVGVKQISGCLTLLVVIILFNFICT